MKGARKRAKKPPLCKCGHRRDLHERIVHTAAARMFMDREAEQAREEMAAKALTPDEYNLRIGHISQKYQGQTETQISSCTLCGYSECSGFRDAGEIGNLAERLSKVEARLDALEDGS